VDRAFSLRQGGSCRAYINSYLDVYSLKDFLAHGPSFSSMEIKVAGTLQAAEQADEQRFAAVRSLRQSCGTAGQNDGRTRTSDDTITNVRAKALS
jgi:hypothetical protein